MGAVELLNHLTPEKQAEIHRILEDEVTKSGKIRGLYAAGIEVKDIAHILDIRYNFAYNVVAQLIKDGIHPIETLVVEEMSTPVTVEADEIAEIKEANIESAGITDKLLGWVDDITQKLNQVIDTLRQNFPNDKSM